MGPVWIGMVFAGLGGVSAIIYTAARADAKSNADAVEAKIRSGTAARGIPATGVCSGSGAPGFANACSTLRNDIDKANADARAVNISLGMMGAGILIAGIWLLVAPKNQGRTTGLLITPYASLDGQSLGIRLGQGAVATRP